MTCSNQERIRLICAHLSAIRADVSDGTAPEACEYARIAVGNLGRSLALDRRERTERRRLPEERRMIRTVGSDMAASTARILSRPDGR